MQWCFQIMVLSMIHFQADPISACIFVSLEFWFLHKGKLCGVDRSPLYSGCSVDLTWGWPMNLYTGTVLFSVLFSNHFLISPRIWFLVFFLFDSLIILTTGRYWAWFFICFSLITSGLTHAALMVSSEPIILYRKLRVFLFTCITWHLSYTEFQHFIAHSVS